MSVVSKSVRAEVTTRAGERCEYCRLPTRGQVATFPIDHVTPRSIKGATVVDILALAGPHCNGCKWNHADGIDPQTGQVSPLFNPRLDSWEANFQWSKKEHGIIEGKTSIGRATIARLKMTIRI